MNNKNTKKNIALLLLSLITGVFLSFSFKQDLDSYNMVNISSVEELQKEIKKQEEEYIRNEKLIVENEKILEEKINEPKKDEEEIKIELQEEINQIKILAGLESLEGEGVEIIISDKANTAINSENMNDDVIHDGDLQIILNDLKRAGAEAISINGQRIVSSSEIKCGGPVIKINKKSSTNPFVILAIGDSEKLFDSIISSGSYGNMLKNIYGLRVDVEKKDSVVVPKHDITEIDFEYLKLQKKGDN